MAAGVGGCRAKAISALPTGFPVRGLGDTVHGGVGKGAERGGRGYENRCITRRSGEALHIIGCGVAGQTCGYPQFE